jgi:hypothetical protein
MTDDGTPWENPDRLRDFAREFVRTGSGVSAAQAARVVNPQYRIVIWAEKLLKRSDVQGWVAEARTEGLDKPKPVTREAIADDLQEVFERALGDGAYAPAVSAKKTQAEVLGLMEKNVRVTFGRDVKELSMDDLERELARLQSEGVIELLPNGVAEDGVEVFGGE